MAWPWWWRFREGSLPPRRDTLALPLDRSRSASLAKRDELAHVSTITIHRSQGSECPAVVIPLTTSSWMMRQRNLLYTAGSRHLASTLAAVA